MAMRWDYRVVEHPDCYKVHEVYYNDSGEPVGFSPEPAWSVGTTVEELSHCLIHQMGALIKPVIPRSQFEKTPRKNQSVKAAMDILRGDSDV